MKPPMSFVFKITNFSMEDDFKPNKKNLISSERLYQKIYSLVTYMY